MGGSPWGILGDPGDPPGSAPKRTVRQFSDGRHDRVVRIVRKCCRNWRCLAVADLPCAFGWQCSNHTKATYIDFHFSSLKRKLSLVQHNASPMTRVEILGLAPKHKITTSQCLSKHLPQTIRPPSLRTDPKDQITTSQC